MFLPVIILIIGLVVLILGAESLVRGASSISKKAGIPSLVIGLTVVAFGTSAPELIVNIFSALKGAGDIAIGNVVGSNIANILLILGVLGVIASLKVQRSTTWKEIPFALLAVLMLFVLGNDMMVDGMDFNSLTRTDGLSLIGFFLIFMYYTYNLAKNGSNNDEEGEIKLYSYPIAITLTLAGLSFLFFGGKLLVEQAIILAELAGLSEMLIGLTIVAIGTSLPELATSIIAVKRGQTDIAVGNIVGSNIFNIFFVLGTTSIIKPLSLSASANFDILVCVLVTFLLFLAMFVGKKHKLERWQASIFIIAYIGYMAYLVDRG